MPFEDEKFTKISAFETVYFWPNLKEDFKEVHRILKKNGQFIIANNTTGALEKDKEAEDIIKRMKIYTQKELIHYLEEAGFSIFDRYNNKKDLLIIKANK